MPPSMSKRQRNPAPRRLQRIPIILALVSVAMLLLSHPFLRTFFHDRSMPSFHSRDQPTHGQSAESFSPFTRLTRKLDRKGVQEFVTTIRQDWRVAIASFLDDTEVKDFSKRRIKYHFDNDVGKITDTTMLVEILEGNVTFTERYKGPHGRASSVKYILQKIVKEKKDSLPGVTFPVIVNDGYRPAVASFGSARHWNSWKALIPVPLGNTRGVAEGWGTPFQGWDAYIDRTIWTTRGNYSWEKKLPKALFRGSLCMQTNTLGSCNDDGECRRATKWDQVNRGVMYTVASTRPDLFDIGFTALKGKPDMGEEQFNDAPMPMAKMEFKEYQRYKFILNVGSNQDWAERLRSLLFTNSAVIMHEAETREFYTPLLQPWVHYIPTDLMFKDLVQNVEWAIENDETVQQIVRNGNAFADRYISERAMQQYWEVAIEEFARLQTKAAQEGLDEDGVR